MKKQNVFVVDETGQRYVKVSFVMHPLIALCDGLTQTFWGKGKSQRSYLTVEDALDWLRREMKDYKSERNLLLEAILVQYAETPIDKPFSFNKEKSGLTKDQIKKALNTLTY